MFKDLELWAEMEEEVKAEVKSYATDFYEHDKKFLSQYAANVFAGIPIIE